MTVVPHPPLETMLAAFDALVDATEAYVSYLEEVAVEMEGRGLGETPLMVWRNQVPRAQAFVELLEDDVLDRLRELVDRTAAMETASKGDFV
jgi:hypothetical protein